MNLSTRCGLGILIAADVNGTSSDTGCAYEIGGVEPCNGVATLDNIPDARIWSSRDKVAPLGAGIAFGIVGVLDIGTEYPCE